MISLDPWATSGEEGYGHQCCCGSQCMYLSDWEQRKLWFWGEMGSVLLVVSPGEVLVNRLRLWTF